MCTGRPKIFFDTQICINAANQKIPDCEWQAALEYIHRTSEYCISALTLGEIILGLAKGDDERFEDAQQRLSRLLPAGPKTFLDFPEYFLANTLDLRIRRPLKLETNFGFSVTVLLWAESKDALRTGVFLPTGDIARINLAQFIGEIETGRKLYVEWFSTLKGSRKPDFSPRLWAGTAMRVLGIESNQCSIGKVANALPAAYEYELKLHDLARNPNYDIQRHVTDLVDAKQLLYLCDPAMVFVTDDTEFRKRLRKNPRIITFAELLKRTDQKQGVDYPTQP